MNTNELIGERLKYIREKENNMSVASFSRLLNEKDHRIRDIESGKQKIPPEIIVKLRNILNINTDWLLTGEGDMYKKDNNERIQQAKELINNIENKKEIITVPFYEDIYASAGAGAYNEVSNASQQLTFSENFLRNMLSIVDFKGLHIITAVGDSMQSTIYDGDKLFVLPLKDTNVSDGGVYVISTPFGVLVKRIYLYPVENKIILHSDNPNIKDEVLEGEITQKVKFLGRVVGILRNRI
jgi:phage repressor protein C with HTH and peptisase S24 domain